jgi:hypothetical protein
MTTRLTLVVPDDLAGHIRTAAGGNISAWLTRLAQRELLARACEVAVAYDREHDDPADEERRLAGLG